MAPIVGVVVAGVVVEAGGVVALSASLFTTTAGVTDGFLSKSPTTWEAELVGCGSERGDRAVQYR